MVASAIAITCVQSQSYPDRQGIMNMIRDRRHRPMDDATRLVFTMNTRIVREPAPARVL